MAYDIIKAHGREIKVETNEGGGSLCDAAASKSRVVKKSSLLLLTFLYSISIAAQPNSRAPVFAALNLVEMFLEGLLSLAIFFNVFFYRATHEREYLYFSLFLFSLGILNLVNITYIYFGSASSYSLLGFAFLQFFLIQFVRYFFKTFNSYQRWDKFLLFLGIVSMSTSLVFIFVDPYYLSGNSTSPGMELVSVILLSLVGLSSLITFILYAKKKNNFTNLAIIGGFPFTIFLTFILILAPRLGESFRSVETACITWFVLFLSLILFIRFNQLRKENAQQELDKERLEKEKEIEKSQLVEQQKIQLEKTVAERTAELKRSLENLKATQAQLIQQEKMASLGEVTAGIAHEIQNPLNFVNNFSEVNRELAEELKGELLADNKEEAISIAYIIIDNEEKINHHGKRADVIVKGMLQHSKASTGKKELTDINKLADEYLRLSYHGMRAKDKSFEVKLKTDFDESIGKVNAVSQDIGRVLLNIFNNAFYAVNEKRKTADNGYEPTVSVQTKRLPDKVEINVQDNGNGIPQDVINKIFQPFFTTKPTGQGTGLGLSLAYDIIKAHGGEIKVESKEGEGTQFLVQLPLNLEK